MEKSANETEVIGSMEAWESGGLMKWATKWGDKVDDKVGQLTNGVRREGGVMRLRLTSARQGRYGGDSELGVRVRAR